MLIEIIIMYLMNCGSICRLSCTFSNYEANIFVAVPMVQFLTISRNWTRKNIYIGEFKNRVAEEEGIKMFKTKAVKAVLSVATPVFDKIHEVLESCSKLKTVLGIVARVVRTGAPNREAI